MRTGQTAGLIAREGSESAPGRGWRWGWRLALFTALLLLFVVLLQTGVVLADPGAVGRLTVGGAAAACAAALLATWVMMSAVESRPPAAVGLALSRRTVADLARGFVLGSVLVASVLLVLAVAGWLRVSYGAWAGPAIVGSILYATVLLLLAALFEELAVRGYVFQVLAEATGPAVAVGGTALVFAVLHGANPGVGWTAIGNTLLAGILLGTLYWRTLSLWWVTGTHFAWNWVMGVGAGLPVSGLDVGEPLVGFATVGPRLWTGGEYGPEAGLVLTLMTLAGIVWTARTPRLTRDPAVLALGPLVGLEVERGVGPGSRGRLSSGDRRRESEEA